MTIAAMNRRGFLQMLGAAASVGACGLLVPDVARKIFLPPAGGWSGYLGLTSGELAMHLDDFEERVLAPTAQRIAEQFDLHASGLNVGDVLTFGDVYSGCVADAHSYRLTPDGHKWYLDCVNQH